MERYSWPGNVRELGNEVRRLCIEGSPDALTPAQLSPEVRMGSTQPGGGVLARSGVTLREVERATILAALLACEGNKTHAARRLGIPRTTLYHLLDRHGVGR